MHWGYICSMSFGIPSLFKVRKGKQFEYLPRYHDPAKERKAELEAMMAAAREGRDHRPEDAGRRLRHEWEHKRRVRSSQNSAYNLRMMGLIAAMLLLVWLFFNL